MSVYMYSDSLERKYADNEYRPLEFRQLLVHSDPEAVTALPSPQRREPPLKAKEVPAACRRALPSLDACIIPVHGKYD